MLRAQHATHTADGLSSGRVRVLCDGAAFAGIKYNAKSTLHTLGDFCFRI